MDGTIPPIRPGVLYLLSGLCFNRDKLNYFEASQSCMLPPVDGAISSVGACCIYDVGTKWLTRSQYMLQG